MSDNSMVIRNATIVDGTGGDPLKVTYLLRMA